MLNLEAASKQDMTLWLFGINRIITRSGKKMVLESGDAPVPSSDKIGKRRFSVKPGATLTSATNQPSNQPSTAANAQAVEAAMKECPLLYEGHVFTCYIEKAGAGGSTIVKSKQFVFYANQNGPPRICWCAPGFRVESELNRIVLKSLTDIYVVSENRLRQRLRLSQFSILFLTIYIASFSLPHFFRVNALIF